VAGIAVATARCRDVDPSTAAEPPPAGWTASDVALQDGRTLHVVQTGSPTGAPVLVVHGTGGDARFWSGLGDDLRGARRVVSYQRAGFGASPPSSSTAPLYHAAADDAATLLRALGGGPADVVGHSAGGIVALDLALRHPGLVRRLVVVEPPFHVKGDPTPAFAATFARMSLVRALRSPACAARLFLRFVTTRTDGASSFDALPVDVQDAVLRSADGILRDLDGGTGEEISVADLRGVAAPTTVLVGSKTAPFFAASSARVAGAVPGARIVVVDGGGHLMPFDAPGAFVAAVRAALVP
jgi:pimeloyl-ACP methyl ester carboxylesterase